MTDQPEDYVQWSEARIADLEARLAQAEQAVQRMEKNCDHAAEALVDTTLELDAARAELERVKGERDDALDRLGDEADLAVDLLRDRKALRERPREDAGEGPSRPGTLRLPSPTAPSRNGLT